MKFLITGAKGQLGQAFRDLFEEKSIPCILTDINQLDEDHIRLDITQLDEVRDFLKEYSVDYIVNCAAYNDVDTAESDWDTANLVNGVGPRNLAIAANEFGSTLVHYSTDYVFDGMKATPYSVDDTPRPISRYGESKLLGEKYVRDSAHNFFLIRVSWLFGKGQINFPTKVINWSQSRNELRIVDDQISAPALTTDVARTTYDLIRTGHSGLYHITNSKYCSRYEWAEFILGQLGWEGELHPAKSSDFNTAAKRPRFSALDSSKTEETVGYILQNWKDATTEFLNQMHMI